ncbi:cupin domain-containing protein [Microbacterium sp. 179-B 1A2 NHS]|uniref:cupin domain-containing protein n=1 Tax=Microbacterium sp. 179-B 1A2 NHS TaxID=3142383 RepID=UPI0039A257AE
MLHPGTTVDAAQLEIPLAPVPAEQVVDGAPEAGWVDLVDGIGVWEHTAGVSTDIEADEVFVVLSGSATVTFPDGSQPPLVLRPGTIGRLAAGTATVWAVHETLRKVYVSGSECTSPVARIADLIAGR